MHTITDNLAWALWTLYRSHVPTAPRVSWDALPAETQEEFRGYARQIINRNADPKN